MKNILLLFLFFGVLSNYSFAQSGFKGGVNFSNYYGKNANYGGTAHSVFVGPVVGYFKDWNIARDTTRSYYFSIGLETNISVKGVFIYNKVKYSEVNPSEIWDISDREMYDYYLELPHIVKLHYLLTQNMQAQLYGGGILSFDIWNVTKSIRNSNPNYSYNPINAPFFTFPFSLEDMPSFLGYSLLAGVTFSYKRFLLDVRYSKSITEIYTGAYLSTSSISLGYNL